MLDKPGRQSFKVMVFDGYGELEDSFSRSINVEMGENRELPELMNPS